MEQLEIKMTEAADVVRGGQAPELLRDPAQLQLERALAVGLGRAAHRRATHFTPHLNLAELLAHQSDVVGIEVNREVTPSQSRGCKCSCAGACQRIQDEVARIGDETNDALHQGVGQLTRMLISGAPMLDTMDVPPNVGEQLFVVVAVCLAPAHAARAQAIAPCIYRANRIVVERESIRALGVEQQRVMRRHDLAARLR
ncbi:MAG: hypothetical protein RML99_05110 [Anaerolineae bacterium]|nr:hypothetical protein [Anaerolineae bacterium]